MAVCWYGEGDNFVFSPFSLYWVLTMLLIGTTELLSDTQDELLPVFGNIINIQMLEELHSGIEKTYKTAEVEKNLILRNRIWTSEKYFPKIKEEYEKKIEILYDTKINLLNSTNSEKEVNDWINNETNGKLDKVIGT